MPCAHCADRIINFFSSSQTDDDIMRVEVIIAYSTDTGNNASKQKFGHYSFVTVIEVPYTFLSEDGVMQ